MDLIEHQTQNDPRVAAKVESMKKVLVCISIIFLFSFLGEIYMNETLYSRSFREYRVLNAITH
jgi:hypothetical protein